MYGSTATAEPVDNTFKNNLDDEKLNSTPQKSQQLEAMSSIEWIYRRNKLLELIKRRVLFALAVFIIFCAFLIVMFEQNRFVDVPCQLHPMSAHPFLLEPPLLLTPELEKTDAVKAFTAFSETWCRLGHHFRGYHCEAMNKQGTVDGVNFNEGGGFHHGDGVVTFWPIDTKGHKSMSPNGIALFALRDHTIHEDRVMLRGYVNFDLPHVQQGCERMVALSEDIVGVPDPNGRTKLVYKTLRLWVAPPTTADVKQSLHSISSNNIIQHKVKARADSQTVTRPQPLTLVKSHELAVTRGRPFHSALSSQSSSRPGEANRDHASPTNNTITANATEAKGSVAAPFLKQMKDVFALFPQLTTVVSKGVFGGEEHRHTGGIAEVHLVRGEPWTRDRALLGAFFSPDGWKFADLQIEVWRQGQPTASERHENSAHQDSKNGFERFHTCTYAELRDKQCRVLLIIRTYWTGMTSAEERDILVGRVLRDLGEEISQENQWNYDLNSRDPLVGIVAGN